ncbi:MAG: SMC-Scp complex subunit ScpB [Fuerstiella sp.]
MAQEPTNDDFDQDFPDADSASSDHSRDSDPHDQDPHDVNPHDVNPYDQESAQDDSVATTSDIEPADSSTLNLQLTTTLSDDSDDETPSDGEAQADDESDDESDDETPNADSDAEEAMGFDDIELAYREALKSIDEAEQQVGNAFMDLADVETEEEDSEPAAFTSIGEELAEDLESAQHQSAEIEAQFEEDAKRITPRCVVEGALFVGGSVALTARKLASLIGQETDARVAVRLIDQLNEDYAAENRPYEIRLHEGGFQLGLREEFSEMQVKVFGLGPREVKLTPEVLELLSFVAYNQPVNQVELSNIKQDKVKAHLRQLIRLQLVEVERTGSKRSDVQYVTGKRFLRLFELESLDDLPQADVFSFK